MSVKLFENTILVDELDVNSRLAAAVIGQTGADNILVSKFLTQIANYLVRSAGNVAVTAGSQDITFSSTFGTTNYSLQVYDINGVGIGVTAQAADKFTIDSLGTGVINYIAIKNI